MPGGVIHPNVLKMAGIDPETNSGFAFGLGFDRLVMIKAGFKDIRVLNSGNLKLLKQIGLNLDYSASFMGVGDSFDLYFEVVNSNE